MRIRRAIAALIAGTQPIDERIERSIAALKQKFSQLEAVIKITIANDRDRPDSLLKRRYLRRLNYSRVINREHTTGRQVSQEAVGFLLGMDMNCKLETEWIA